jgi:hypothetical protein
VVCQTSTTCTFIGGIAGGSFVPHDVDKTTSSTENARTLFGTEVKKTLIIVIYPVNRIKSEKINAIIQII